MENKPLNGVTDQALRATPVSKHLTIYNVHVSFFTVTRVPAVVGWVQVYYNGGSGVAGRTRDTTSCQSR